MKFFISFEQFNGKMRPSEIARTRPLGLGALILPIDKRRPLMHSSRTQSASVRCFSMLVGLFFHISYCLSFSREKKIHCLSCMLFLSHAVMDLTPLISSVLLWSRAKFRVGF